MTVIKKKSSLFKKMKQDWQNYALMAPFLVFFLLFTLVPIIVAVGLSFTDFNGFEIPSFVGYDNYVRMFLDDDIFLIAIRNTLIFAAITGPISYFLCFFLAVLIHDCGKGMRSFLTLVYYAPVLSGTAYAIWKFIFSADSYGLINGVLVKLNIISEPIGWLTDPKYILVVLIVVQLWLSLGTGFLAFIAGLNTVDTGLYEAGLIDGIQNRFQETWYITIPSMRSQLVFGAVMQIISSFSVGDISIQLAGFPSAQYSAETIVTHIMDFGSVRFELGYACALACFLFLIIYIFNKFITSAINSIGQ